MLCDSKLTARLLETHENKTSYCNLESSHSGQSISGTNIFICSVSPTKETYRESVLEYTPCALVLYLCMYKSSGQYTVLFVMEHLTFALTCDLYILLY